MAVSEAVLMGDLRERLALARQQTLTIPTLPKPETPWYEQPKVLGEKAMEKVGEGISKVPLLPEVLKPVGKVFSWIHEELEKPFAAIILSPFSPDIPWKKGESWLDHQKREYDAWEAPTYVKGVAEFAMPLWWMPWFGWAKVGAKALGLGAKTTAQLATQTATKGIFSVSARGLPKAELLDKVLFEGGRWNKFIRASEKVPMLGRVVKMVGGEKAFVDPLSKSALNTTRKELVKMGFVSDMRNGIKSIYVPRLQAMGSINKILNMDAKGIVSNIVDKAGGSNYLYDVLEGAIKNPENYKFLTKEAKDYVKVLGESLDDLYKLARAEGVKVPKATLVHRIVKGKTAPETGEYFATEYGSLFEAGRVYKTMKEGVEKGIDYGLSIDEALSSTVSHYVRQIARKRFSKAINRLGKKPRQLWDETSEGVEYNLLKASELQGVLKQPERLAELTLAKADFVKHFQGKQVLSYKGEELSKFTARPEFGNSLFPKDVVKTAEKVLNDESQKWLAGMSSISGTSRMLTAAMDLSAPFIQGLPLLGRNPLAWAKSVKGMLEFAIKPENLYKYMSDPKIMQIRMERILSGGSAQTFEFFEALAPLQRLIKKLPGGQKVSGIVGQTYGRAETAFTGFGEIARNHLWQALRKPNMSSEELLTLSRTVDRMTGVMSTEALGIGKTQQDFENAFVFFAPRYTRAGLSLVSDTLRGGMAGAEARKALGALSGGGLSMYYGACSALGQQPNLNPNSGRFLTIKVGESHIGIGGIIIALMRLTYDVGATAVEDPQNLIIPLRDGSLNRWDNPFVRFMFSRTAPLTSAIVTGAIEQTNYFGEPFESVGDWGKYMADKITPIALQNIMRDPDVRTSTAEFAGMRVFPKSPWELLDESRDQKSIDVFGQPYSNLNDLNKAQVNKDTTVIKLQEDVDSQTASRGDVESVAFLNREREMESARQVYEGTLGNLQDAYDAGAITGYDFKEGMSDAGYGLGTTYKHIDSQYPEVMKIFDKPRTVKDKFIGDVAYSEYMDRMYQQNEFLDQFGLFNFDKFNAFIESFKQKYGQEVYEYVLARKASKDDNLPPLAKEYKHAQEILKPYWAIETDIRNRFGSSFADSQAGRRMITKMRQLERLKNPEIDKYIKMFYTR